MTDVTTDQDQAQLELSAADEQLVREVNARGHFPTEQAAMKCLYLAIMSLDPTGRGR
jgi:putative transposase